MARLAQESFYVSTPTQSHVSFHLSLILFRSLLIQHFFTSAISLQIYNFLNTMKHLAFGFLPFFVSWMQEEIFGISWIFLDIFFHFTFSYQLDKLIHWSATLIQYFSLMISGFNIYLFTHARNVLHSTTVTRRMRKYPTPKERVAQCSKYAFSTCSQLSQTVDSRLSFPSENRKTINFNES